MYHSITFTIGNVSKNTYTDWRLVPTVRPVINPPKPKTKYVDIPGGDGSIDLTDTLAGRPAYANREGTIEFTVLNDYASPEGPSTYNWVDVYTSVMQFLHGKNARVVLEDDPTYYYEGRITLDSWTTDRAWSKITISYSLGPYKYSLAGTSFTLENGTIAINTGSNVSTNLAARTVGKLALSVGDVITVVRVPELRGPVDHLRSVLYYGPTSSSTYPGQTQGYVHDYYDGGNEYIVPKNGYYRVILTTWDNVEISNSMRNIMAKELQIKKGGVL